MAYISLYICEQSGGCNLHIVSVQDSTAFPWAESYGDLGSGFILFRMSRSVNLLVLVQEEGLCYECLQDDMPHGRRV